MTKTSHASDHASSLIDSPRAWVAAIAVAAANGLGFGTVYTFGTYFDAMATEFGSGRGATAFIFGLTLLFFFGSGLVSGPIYDWVGPRPLLAVGGVLFVVGLLITANATSLGVGIVAYSIGVGLGGGMYIAPLTALIGAIFVRYRALALALAAVGNGLGTLILSPLSESIIANRGWRAGYATIAVIGAVVVVISMAAVVNPPVRPEPPRGFRAAAATVRRVAGDAGFRSLFFASFLMSISLLVAFAFIVPFAVDEGVSARQASALVGIIGFSSIFGRLGLMAATRQLAPVRLMQLTLVIQPLAYGLWILAGGNFVVLAAFAVLLGVSYGGFVAVAPESLIYLVGLEGLGTTIGILFASFGLGGLIGPPLAGFLVDEAGGAAAKYVVVLLVLGALVLSIPMGRQAARTEGV